MKNFQRLLRLILFCILIVAVMSIGNMLFGQTTPDDPTDDISFPYILLLPYFIGVAVHWIKKYMENPANTFIKWFLTNIIWSITTLVAGIGSLWAMWGLGGHGGLYPVTIGAYIAVFWIGVGADSFNQPEGGNKSKTSSP